MPSRPVRVISAAVAFAMLTAGISVGSVAQQSDVRPAERSGKVTTVPLTEGDGIPTEVAKAGVPSATAGQSRGLPALQTGELEAPEFVVAALTWDADEDLAPDAVIEVRVREKRGWSDWLEVEADDAGPEDGTGRAGTDPFITGGATAVQVRVDGRPNDLPANLSLELIPAGASGGTEMLSGARGAAGGAGSTSRLVVPMGQGVVPSSVDIDGVGTIFTRADWGADEANWTPRYAPLRAAVVHHTAGTNNYTADQSAGIVRAIFVYHAVTRDWGDIGYNFLVDKYGQIFEGREGSLQAHPDTPAGWLVEAGHARGYNRGSLGISAMGDFTLSTAPDAAPIVNAMAKVIAWKFKEANLDATAPSGFFAPDARSFVTYAAGAELPRIFGHGDVALTACPGGLYDRLGDLRAQVRDGYTRSSDTTPPVVRASIASDGLITLAATDNQGGVPEIFYTVDGSPMFWWPAHTIDPGIPDTRYSEPIAVDTVTTLTVVAVDAAGNTSFASSPELESLSCAGPANDLDGDCAIDLVTRTPDGKLWLNSGDGEGAWNAWTQIGWGWGVMNLIETVGDVDGDGQSDLIARDVRGDLWLYPGPDFYGPDRVKVGWGWNVMSMVTGSGDVNGDEVPDLVARDLRGDLWLYPGPDFYGPDRVKIGWNWNVMSTVSGVGDFNGDEHGDLVALQISTGDLWLYRGDGFSGATRLRIGTGWNVMDAIIGVGDFDGDLTPDLIAREPSTGYLWLYPGNGTGGLESRTRLSTPEGVEWIWIDIDAFA